MLSFLHWKRRWMRPTSRRLFSLNGTAESYSIILNGKGQRRAHERNHDRLETGVIQQLFDSDRYKAYLTTMAKFHNYSFRYQHLTDCHAGVGWAAGGGLAKWKDTFHRTVKKGEKGISEILLLRRTRSSRRWKSWTNRASQILDKRTVSR